MQNRAEQNNLFRPGYFIRFHDKNKIILLPHFKKNNTFVPVYDKLFADEKIT